ncbi:MAG: phage antirepressor KilAC domain-containing protein [Ruminococcus sp.]
MNELIKVNYDNADRPTVSGRELWEALEVETPYKKWFDRMAEYGFSENLDFWTNLSESTGGRPSTDHQLTIPMAKELCMLQRTEKGKFWRQYFINVEEKWNSPEAIMARALQLSNVKMKQLETTVSDLQKQMEQDKPKVLFADSVTASSSSILIGELAKLIKQNGVDIGQRRLFEWMRVNGYLIKRKGSEYNLPTQRSMEQGLMEIKETSVVHTGYTTISKTPKVTGKGQVYFINLFLGQA